MHSSSDSRTGSIGFIERRIPHVQAEFERGGPGATADLIAASLTPVAHSAWAFIRYEAERRIGEIHLQPGLGVPEHLENIARAEHALHLLEDEPLMVERSRAPLAPYHHGLTLICGDDDGISGMLIVLRDGAGARFSERDADRLRESLVTVAAHIGRLRETTPHQVAPEHVRTRAQPSFYVLDQAYQIELSWIPPGASTGLAEDSTDTTVLDAPLEAAVRTLTAGWDFNAPDTLREGVAVPKASYVLRVVPLLGQSGGRIGVSIERFKTRNAIRSAALNYRLSRRELDVLGLLLEGRENKEVAAILKIAPSTVNDHVKRMLAKTQSRNRAELVARALGWRTDR